MDGIALPRGDLTAEFNKLLQLRNAPPAGAKADIEKADSFLKEAHRINSHIKTLHKELRHVRQAYLSTAAQPRRTTQAQQSQGRGPLTDREREEIDANAKQMISELNASIRAVDDAEQLRRETAVAIARRTRYGGSLGGVLGSWASGAGMRRQNATEEGEGEAQERQTNMHRDGVLWFLRQRLERCCQTQQDMMEARLRRELDRSKGFLAADFADFAAATGMTAGGTSHSGGGDGDGGDLTYRAGNAELTADQIQMFEKGNQDMMKHYESQLAKVQTAEKSLLEISELQSLLGNNLAIQSAHIEQLVADSMSTADNVGGGNRELTRATRRPSAARYTFFAASGLCAFLVLWDLII